MKHLEQLGIEIVDRAQLSLAFDVPGDGVDLHCFDDDEDAAAIFAVDEIGLVGILCFTQRRGTLSSLGTWVCRDRRREGIAELLWSIAITEFDIYQVDVMVVSDRGYTLIETLRQQHPDVRFHVDHFGMRVLRVLRAA